MLKSMTGYGNAILEREGITVRVEIKSLNSRGLDLSMRLPKELSEYEIGLRSQIANSLVRGKVSVYVESEFQQEKLAAETLDKDVIIAYYNQLHNIAQMVGAPTDNILPALVQQGSLFEGTDATVPADAAWPLVEEALPEALEKFERFRKDEGKALENEFRAYIESIRSCLEKVEQMKDSRIQRIRDGLMEKLQTVMDDSRIDSSRLEQELVYYAEKLDITEEIVRLRTHINYFLETMEDEAAGKKLSFISQEMGREINTIGSKANDAMIQRETVIMKDELEKIKEQVQNVL